MVGVTLPFGWKDSPMYVKLLDWVPRTFFRSLGVACSLYIDDHLNGELFFFGRFLVAPIVTENSCIQLSIGGGGNVHSLYSSCELGLFSGHLQMRSWNL